MKANGILLQYELSAHSKNSTVPLKRIARATSVHVKTHLLLASEHETKGHTHSLSLSLFLYCHTQPIASQREDAASSALQQLAAKSLMGLVKMSPGFELGYVIRSHHNHSSHHNPFLGLPNGQSNGLGHSFLILLFNQEVNPTNKIRDTH